ncbi:uncharacterized protein MELLADRAFT_106730 [Melampsora larici-populina 98AG31]|uniref:Uncharacterized protein n=1 Tax=Melampsora larici-populina (strain 98AG31 / pathotype 3-4-7) TaxID=747676 RepID=F4RMG5_MELLP|nr:uncharacterized protein MELLADRAFT_106730 [Melampsora larici-populina 98AG31]EGG06479.1 hypothetical protein MELLADRAFT_106730 [Melampsora larici-populina 98AG31]
MTYYLQTPSLYMFPNSCIMLAQVFPVVVFALRVSSSNLVKATTNGQVFQCTIYARVNTRKPGCNKLYTYTAQCTGQRNLILKTLHMRARQVHISLGISHKTLLFDATPPQLLPVLPQMAVTLVTTVLYPNHQTKHCVIVVPVACCNTFEV